MPLLCTELSEHPVPGTLQKVPREDTTVYPKSLVSGADRQLEQRDAGRQISRCKESTTPKYGRFRSRHRLLISIVTAYRNSMVCQRLAVLFLNVPLFAGSVDT